MTREEGMIIELKQAVGQHSVRINSLQETVEQLEKRIETLTKKTNDHVSERKNKRAKGKPEDSNTGLDGGQDRPAL